jgi:putative addiction module component (TIGR02574 family)
MACDQGALLMTPSLKDLGLENLSVEEKLDLAEALQESAARDMENTLLTEAQKAELDRRIALWDADQTAGFRSRPCSKTLLSGSAGEGVGIADIILSRQPYGAISMTPSLDDLGLAGLDWEVRLQIADILYDSVTEELENRPLTDAQRSELECRLALSKADPKRGTPWEIVLKRARARHGR